MNIRCLILGHHWWTDESTTAGHLVFSCTRCGAKHNGMFGPPGRRSSGNYAPGHELEGEITTAATVHLGIDLSGGGDGPTSGAV